MYAASADTELVFSNTAVFPFSNGGLGFRDLQLRCAAGGSFSIVEGTLMPAVSGCVFDFGGRSVNIRREVQVILGTAFAGQWANSGVNPFPSEWDCASYLKNASAVNIDTNAELRGPLIADSLVVTVGRNSSFRPNSPNFIGVTVNGVEGSTTNLVGSAAAPSVLDGQYASSASTGIVNLATNARLLFNGPLTIKNSGGHGVLADTMSYADLSGGVLLGTGNRGIGVKLDRGAQIDLAVASLPTITGFSGELKVGDNVAQNWATLNPATTVVDAALLSRATSR